MRKIIILGAFYCWHARCFVLNVSVIVLCNILHLHDNSLPLCKVSEKSYLQLIWSSIGTIHLSFNDKAIYKVIGDWLCH